MKSLGILLFTLVTSTVVSAQGWRGIKPLRSTCEDVKHALGVEKCEYPNSTYRFENETVTVSFVMCPCPVSCYHQSGGWNVPKGTVGGITRALRKPLPIASFGVDDKWTKSQTDFIGQLLYNHYEEGISLSAINGEVVNVSYYAPLNKNQNLLCPKCFVSPPPNAEKDASLSEWFNAYGDIPFETEKTHLDQFAGKLQGRRAYSTGYIVVYGSCITQKGEAKARAERAKEYLVSAYGIKGDRIVTIDGGQREEILVELHIRKRGLPAPLVFSSIYPTENAKERRRILN